MFFFLKTMVPLIKYYHIQVVNCALLIQIFNVENKSKFFDLPSSGSFPPFHIYISNLFDYDKENWFVLSL